MTQTALPNIWWLIFVLMIFAGKQRCVSLSREEGNPSSLQVGWFPSLGTLLLDFDFYNGATESRTSEAEVRFPYGIYASTQNFDFHFTPPVSEFGRAILFSLIFQHLSSQYIDVH